MTAGRIRPLATVTAIGAAACALGAGPVPAWAKANHHYLPATHGKITVCHKTLFKVGGRLPVRVDIAAQKGKHPGKALLSCANAQSVAVKGERYYHKYPFGLGKKVKVGKATYMMGVAAMAAFDGKPLSGPLYGWTGGGVVIYLINPTG